jgi:crossover junction endodeoxyribonuclease RuvC
MFDSIVLGVDPGVARLGLALVGRRDRTHHLLEARVVVTAASREEAGRLAEVADAVREAIVRHRPASVAVERVAWNRNQVSALRVARATGAVMAEAARAGLPVEEYGPNEVKIAVAGAGNADKREVRGALARIHGLRGVPAEADAADAVAVALTHLLGRRIRDLARAGSR